MTLVAIDGINKAGNRSLIGTVITRVDPTSQSLNYTRYTVLSDNRLQIDFNVGGKKCKAIVQTESYSDNAEAKTLTWQGY